MPPRIPWFGRKEEGDDSPGMKEARQRIEHARREGSRELDLSGLKLTSVPEALLLLTELQMLNLSNNQLTSVPEALGQLTALQRLDLSFNQLTSVPEALGQLTALQLLYLSNNQLTSVPEALGQLTALQRLYLFHNQLTSVPEVLGQLTALDTLWLNKNQLTSVPEALGQLAALQKLHLSNNQLTSLPEALRTLPNLKQLFLHGNPGLGIPEDALGPTWRDVRPGHEKPPKEILDYYFKHHPPRHPSLVIPSALSGSPAPPAHAKEVFVSVKETQESTWQDISINKAEPKPPKEILDHYFKHNLARPASPVIPEAPAVSPPPVASHAYDVFVSAKSEDYGHARGAAAFLRKAGLRVFFSEEELPEMGNSEYFDAIDTALDSARHMLVVASSQANVTGKWVKKEWQAFLNEKLSGRKAGNLVTLLCGTMKISDLPLSLRQHEARPIGDLARVLAYLR